MNIDSIIFDLDGTLWDSTDTVLKSWNTVLKANKEIKSPITMEILESIIFPYLEEETRMKIMKQCCKEEKALLLKEGGVLYPGLENTLQILSQGYPLFIVSNCQCGYIETFLERHQLGKYFKDAECSGNTGLIKGENIKRVIKRNNLEHSIMVGDTQGDRDAARLAGIPFVFAKYGFGKVEDFDYSINEFKELLELVKR
jgi:phosphoglycolate phosphatase